MASSKPKKTTAKAKTTAKPKAAAAKTAPKKAVAAKPVKATAKPAAKAVEKKVETRVAKTDKKGFKEVLKDFFAKKCDPSENILTIFHNKKIYGALIAELLGTMLLTIVLLTLGLYQPLYIFFVVIAVTLAVFKLSGANFNPLITVGMMASRRMSAIRGVLYILAQIVGAWLGLVIVNAFRTASGADVDLPVMSEIVSFWPTAMLEFFGATMIAFFFAKALQYKHSSLTFAVTVAGGVMIAFVAVYLISYNYFGLTNNFMMNPAIALMHQILPSSGDTFGALLGDIAIALTTYVIFPMLGGVIGFYLSDITSKLNDEDVKM